MTLGATQGAPTSVPSSTTNQTFLPAVTDGRFGATVFNDSTANLYVLLGKGASSTAFTCKVAAGGYYETPFRYSGQLDGVWDAANGSARVTELT